MDIDIDIRIDMKKVIYTILIIAVVITAIVLTLKYTIINTRDQKIIIETEQTYELLKKAYEKTLETESFEWEKGKMNTEIFAKAFVKNLPIKKDCQANKINDNECFPYELNLARDIEGYKERTSFRYYKVKLKNDIGVGFVIDSPACNMVRKRCGNVYIDVNGASNGPNKLSDDIYNFGIYKDGIKLFDLEENHLPNCVYGIGITCSTYLLKFRNRDYKSLTPRKAKKLGLNLVVPNKKYWANRRKFVY